MIYFTDFLTNLLIRCSKVFLEKLTVPQTVDKYPVCYGNRRFISLFARANLSRSYARSIPSTPF